MRQRATAAILALALGSAAPAAGLPARPPVGPGAVGAIDCDLIGHIDTGWGFAFDLPDPFPACETESHDLVIPLGAGYADRTITTRGDFNSGCVDALSTLEERLADISAFDLVREHPRVMRREAALLGGKPARRVVVSWRNRATAEPMLRDTIVALGGDPVPPCAAPGVVFSIELVAPRSTYDADKGLLDKILRSSRSVAVPG